MLSMGMGPWGGVGLFLQLGGGVEMELGWGSWDGTALWDTAHSDGPGGGGGLRSGGGLLVVCFVYL